ncbi:MAG: glycosyltransferase, partial [Syntrophomonadaceae bacterium]|nr:glycosyltransferase [Syntrophomonadaceae bacterium]
MPRKMDAKATMKTNPLISIITPCYNSALFIAQTIKSVIAQTYKNWEMIIVDDCSTDTSFDIALNYAAQDKRIKV